MCSPHNRGHKCVRKHRWLVVLVSKSGKIKSPHSLIFPGCVKTARFQFVVFLPSAVSQWVANKTAAWAHNRFVWTDLLLCVKKMTWYNWWWRWGYVLKCKLISLFKCSCPQAAEMSDSSTDVMFWVITRNLNMTKQALRASVGPG